MFVIYFTTYKGKKKYIRNQLFKKNVEKYKALLIFLYKIKRNHLKTDLYL